MRRVVERIFGVLGLQTQEVSILFVSDRYVRRLNKCYRGIDQPTDVLAFSMREGEWTDIQPQLLGDVVISVETAARQAKEVGHSLDRELTILLVHGILHLLGYDHMEKRDAERMQAQERVVLSEIESP
ncbi:MAG: rRNA maturation RNase YbeY [bacterium]